MPIEKILIEYAKLHLQLTSANEQISQLQQSLKVAQDALKSAVAAQVPATPPTNDQV